MNQNFFCTIQYKETNAKVFLMFGVNLLAKWWTSVTEIKFDIKRFVCSATCQR